MSGIDGEGVKIRQATETDLPGIYQVWYLNEIRGDPNPPPPRSDDSTFTWELRSGRMLVAEQDGELVGFASTLTRSDKVNLAELFVKPDNQSSGVGRALLKEVMPEDGRVHWTSASIDHRGLSLYTRHGMRPRWPQFWLFGRADQLGIFGGTGDYHVFTAEANDPILHNWDADLSGRERAEDRRHWLETGGAIPLWINKEGQRVGYAYVHPRSPDALWNADAMTIGPIGVHASQDVVGAVLVVIRWARSKYEPKKKIRMLVPGPNLALPSLLSLGFHITYVETYCSNSDQPIYDPTRYVCAGAWM